MTDLGKEIWFVEYLDHAFHVGKPEDAIKKPYKLWSCGVVEKEDARVLLIRNYGSTSHDREYTDEAYQLVLKDVIISRKLLGVIGETIKLGE